MKNKSLEKNPKTIFILVLVILSINFISAEIVYQDENIIMGYIEGTQSLNIKDYPNCYTSIGDYFWLRSDYSCKKHPFLNITIKNNILEIDKNSHIGLRASYVCLNDDKVGKEIIIGKTPSADTKVRGSTQTYIGKDLKCVTSVGNFFKERIHSGLVNGEFFCSYNQETGILTRTIGTRNWNDAGRELECNYVCINESSDKASEVLAMSYKETSGTEKIGSDFECSEGLNYLYRKGSGFAVRELSYNPLTGFVTRGHHNNNNKYPSVSSHSYFCLTKKPYTIVCSTNSECGTDGFIEENFCIGNMVYRNFQQFFCNNPGTGDSYCSDNIFPKFIKACGTNQKCSDGMCIKIKDEKPPVIELLKPENKEEVYSPVEFSYNVSDESDLAYCKLFINSNEVLKDKDVEQGINYFDYALSPGNYLWYILCSDIYNNLGVSKTRTFKVLEPACFKDSDCGIDGFVSSTEVCKNNNVYASFITSLCKNPGLPNAYCTSSVSLKLKQDCGESYCKEPTQPYCIENSVYVNQKCYDKGCECGSCYNLSYQKETKLMDCEFGCENGKCIDFVDEEGPIVNLLKPKNNSVQHGVVEFWYTAQDESGVKNCSLIINSKIISSTNDISDSINVFELGFDETEKNYIAFVECYDNYDNKGESNEVTFYYTDKYCEVDSDCPGIIKREKVCDGNDIVEKITRPVCINNLCTSSISYEFVWTCARGCVDGVCRASGSRTPKTYDDEITSPIIARTTEPLVISNISFNDDRPITLDRPLNKDSEEGLNFLFIILIVLILLIIILIFLLIFFLV